MGTVWPRAAQPNGRTSYPAASRAARTAPRVTDRAGRVPVHAHRVDAGRQGHRPVRDGRGVVQHRARLGARPQPPVLAVRTVREALGVDGPPRVGREREHQRARHPEHRQVPGAVEHGAGLVLVDGHPVVERSVGLEVPHPGALLRRDGGEGRHLVGDLVAQHGVRHVEGDPAEARPVVVGHLRADRDARGGRRPRRPGA